MYTHKFVIDPDLSYRCLTSLEYLSRLGHRIKPFNRRYLNIAHFKYCHFCFFFSTWPTECCLGRRMLPWQDSFHILHTPIKSFVQRPISKSLKSMKNLNKWRLTIFSCDSVIELFQQFFNFLLKKDIYTMLHVTWHSLGVTDVKCVNN